MILLDLPKCEDVCLMAGVEQPELHDALRTMGKKYLKPEFRDAWTPDRPTKNYCYVVTEFVYWYSIKELRKRLYGDSWPGNELQSRVRVFHTKSPDDPSITHWFCAYRHYHGFEYIYDLTADQFDNWNYDIYTKARPGFFIQSGARGPSKRAKVLAGLMGYREDYWNDDNYDKAHS